MAFQDDEREIEIRTLFGLSEPENRSRQDTDGILKVNDKVIEFELKSTIENSSVTTARDVGFNHLEKWKTKHWIVGIYKKNKLEYAVYMPPSVLLPWIEEKEEYIRVDYKLAEIIHSKLSLNEMYTLVGKKKNYTYEDARKLHKNQLRKDQYLQMMDIEDGYSPQKMLSLLHQRINYLMLRGYTLNNPHIPNKYIKLGYKIEKNYKSELKKLILKNIS